MASSTQFILQLFFVILLFHVSFATRKLHELVQVRQTPLLRYHSGTLLSGKLAVNLIWYGKFDASQRAIVSDFITSLSCSSSKSQPSVATWWKTTQKYYQLANAKRPLSLYLGKQVLDQSYSFGKSLTQQQLELIASNGEQKNAITVVLTASDVTVNDFCMNSCGSHWSFKSAFVNRKGKHYKSAAIWVGNPETQCPGYCAWPFHQPIYGPQSPPLVAPNNVGADAIVMNLATSLAGTATNPFGNGFYQGPAEAPLEAASACPGVYGKGAYPGYAGNLLVNPTTGASYNAKGCNGRQYLLPSLYDPSTSTCSTLV